MVENVIPLANTMESHSEQFHIRLKENEISMETFPRIVELIKKYPGKIPLVLCITTQDGKAVFVDTSEQYSVTVTAGLLEELSMLLGEGHYKIKPSDKVPVVKPRFNRGEWAQKDGDKGEKSS